MCEENNGKCAWCGKDTKIDVYTKQYRKYCSISCSKSMNVNSKAYYDRYLKRDGDGKCTWCGKETEWYNKKYRKYCSRVCAVSDDPRSQAYYDRYLKQESDGYCIICGKETNWIHQNKKYAKYCSNVCQMKNPENEILRSKTCLEKYGTDKYFYSDDYKNKMVEKFGVEQPMHSDVCKEKMKNTMIGKYGVGKAFDMYSSEDIAKRKKETCLKRYGTETYMRSDQARQKMEDLGYWTPIIDMDIFYRYRLDVTAETYKHKKKLFESWNGRCFYTGEVLITNEEFRRDNPNLKCSKNILQPTIDHKISVMYGFLNNIPANVIGSFDNLCITSRSYNSKKKHRSVHETN